VHVIKAKYEDTPADIGTANDLGYLEMIAANPGVDPCCRAPAPKSSCRPVTSCRRARVKASSSTWPSTACITSERAERGNTFLLGKAVVGVRRSPTPRSLPRRQTRPGRRLPPIRKEHAADGDILPAVVPAGPDNPLGPFKFTLACRAT
jgi:L,D-transpeptidase ErfK/SrfK